MLSCHILHTQTAERCSVGLLQFSRSIAQRPMRSSSILAERSVLQQFRGTMHELRAQFALPDVLEWSANTSESAHRFHRCFEHLRIVGQPSESTAFVRRHRTSAYVQQWPSSDEHKSAHGSVFAARTESHVLWIRRFASQLDSRPDIVAHHLSSATQSIGACSATNQSTVGRRTLVSRNSSIVGCANANDRLQRILAGRSWSHSNGSVRFVNSSDQCCQPVHGLQSIDRCIDLHRIFERRLSIWSFVDQSTISSNRSWRSTIRISA